MAESKEVQELMQIEQELANLKELDNNQDYGSPSPEKKENQFRFFKYMLDFYESWKIGNLKDDEIGKFGLSVRSNLDLALYVEAEGMDYVGEYFRNKARNVSDPTLGRKGFMSQLTVTQIRKDQKINSAPIEKKRWFGGNSNEQQQEG